MDLLSQSPIVEYMHCYFSFLLGEGLWDKEPCQGSPGEEGAQEEWMASSRCPGANRGGASDEAVPKKGGRREEGMMVEIIQRRMDSWFSFFYYLDWRQER